MKNQALFSSKDKSKKLKCRLLQFSFGVLRVKHILQLTFLISNNDISKYLLISKYIVLTYFSLQFNSCCLTLLIYQSKFSRKRKFILRYQ